MFVQMVFQSSFRIWSHPWDKQTNKFRPTTYASYGAVLNQNGHWILGLATLSDKRILSLKIENNKKKKQLQHQPEKKHLYIGV